MPVFRDPLQHERDGGSIVLKENKVFTKGRKGDVACRSRTVCEWIGRVADDGNERGPDRAPAVRQTAGWGDPRA
jgi:hypothetical protein